jgi:hypothetical protein
MYKPPRDKKENIMTRDCMLWLNLPHVVSQGLMVIAVTIAAMYMHTGQILQPDIERLCEYMTDKSWTDWDKKECKEPISCPYYCMCHRWDGSAWITMEDGVRPYAILLENGTKVTKDRSPVMHQDTYGYGPSGDLTDVKTTNYTHREKGWTYEEWVNRIPYEEHFQTSDPPAWPLSSISPEARLHVSKGVQLVDNYTAAGPLPPQGVHRDDFLNFKHTSKRLDKLNCMANGLTKGRSTSFITAVMCEMLRAYTVRSTQPVHEVWNRNWIMHGACASSFLLTVSLTFIPGVKELFKLDTPAWFFYGVAFLFALGCMIIDELSKVGYRRVLLQRETGDKGAVERKQIKERVDMVVEMLHQVEQGVERNSEDLVQNRAAIATVKKVLEEQPKTGKASKPPTII